MLYIQGRSASGDAKFYDKAEIGREERLVISVGVRHVPRGSVCVQHRDGQCEHTLRLPDYFLACCALSDLRFSFVTMSLAQAKTTVRVSPIMVAELA